MESKKIFFNNVWVEITVLTIINIILFALIIAGYNLSSRLPALLLFQVFLVGVNTSTRKYYLLIKSFVSLY